MSNEFVTVKREVLEQALDAMDSVVLSYGTPRHEIETLRDRKKELRAALEQPGAEAVFLVATGETHNGEETYTRHDGCQPPLCDCETLYTAPQPAQQALDIKPPNNSGETMCVVRWMAETPNGWIGSYDKAALEQFAAPKPAHQPFPEAVAEVESTVHGAGGFHCRLLAYTMPPVGVKLYATPPDTEALLNENRVLRGSLERCKNVGSATASCWDDDKKEADALLRQALEAMEVHGSEWVILEQNAIAAIRKYLGEA